MAGMTFPDFQVNRTNIRERQVLQQESRPLESGEVRMKVESFALTANNVTYAAAGDMLDYWGFFPVELPWGHVPAMGHGEVVESANTSISTGGRYFGFFPMAGEHVFLADATGSGMWDAREHRAAHAPAYRQFTDLSKDPTHDPDREDQVALLRGLFMTSFLAEDLLDDNNYFGAEATLVTSASSKTSIALGWCLQQRGSHSVALTSETNRAFVESLGCYDEVITYDHIDELDPARPSAVVDMAGNNQVLAAIHHHFGDNLTYSCAVGASHWEHFGAGSGEPLPGPAPTFFFAPAQIEKRNAEWGDGEVMRRLGEQWSAYVDFADTWLEVERGNGADDLDAAWMSLVEGAQPPHRGLIQSLA